MQKDKNANVCSGQCRDEAWDSYHKHECGQLDLLHSVGIGHLAVRTLLVAGREQLLSIRSAVRAGTYAASAADPYSAVYQLQHHLDRRPAEEQFQYALTPGHDPRQEHLLPFS